MVCDPHYLKGALFENLVINEFITGRCKPAPVRS
jgi:hypothetical protein